MADEPDLTDVIVQTATDPKEYEADGIRTVNHSPKDIVEAQTYLNKQASASSGFAAIGRVQFVPPGAVGGRLG